MGPEKHRGFYSVPELLLLGDQAGAERFNFLAELCFFFALLLFGIGHFGTPFCFDQLLKDTFLNCFYTTTRLRPEFLPR